MLESLDLSNTHFDAEASEELAKGVWPALKHVALNFNMMTLETMEPLAAAPWAGLTSLSLSHNRLGEGALAGLTRMQLPCLESLLLACNNLSLATQQLSTGHWLQLKYLDLTECCMYQVPIGDWPKLRSLILYGNTICCRYGNYDFSVLATRFPMLCVLDLSDNCLEMDDLDLLLETCWPALEELFLSENDFNIECLSLLVEACGSDIEAPGQNKVSPGHGSVSSWPILRMIEL